MNVKSAIFGRRTVHLFDKQKVSETIILNAIEAANQAPCHRLTFPWRFYSVGLETRKRLLNLAIKLKSQNKEIDDYQKKNITDKFLNPSHLLLVSQVLNSNPLIKKEDYAACSCAIQNLSISLSSEGVFTKWSTGKVTSLSETYEATNIDPNHEEIIGFIWIGYGKILPEISRPLISHIYKKI